MFPDSKKLNSPLNNGILVIVNVKAKPKITNVLVEPTIPNNMGVMMIKNAEKITKTTEHTANLIAIVCLDCLKCIERRVLTEVIPERNRRHITFLSCIRASTYTAFLF